MSKQSKLKVRNSSLQCTKETAAGLLHHELYAERHVGAARADEEAQEKTESEEHRLLFNAFRIAPGKHALEGIIEEYCFNRLSERKTLLLERHLLECAECAAQVREQQRFIACMKKALLGLRNAERTDEAREKSPILSVCAVAGL
jgi:hypothetical protein